MMAKIVNGIDKMSKAVNVGYQKIENGVVSAYRRIESGAVKGFETVRDRCVARLFAKEGEGIEDAKVRLSAKN